MALSPRARVTTLLMPETSWAAEERRLWDIIVNDSAPKPRGIKAKDKKVRAEALKAWDKETERRRTAGWQALNALLRHLGSCACGWNRQTLRVESPVARKGREGSSPSSRTEGRQSRYVTVGVADTLAGKSPAAARSLPA